jgi:hypothetical protein
MNVAILSPDDPKATLSNALAEFRLVPVVTEVIIEASKLFPKAAPNEESKTAHLR